MKPSWILSILLSMVGTGFGQDVPHVSCWIFDDAHKAGQTIVCPKHIVTIPANGSAVWWFAGTQIPSDSFTIHTDESVDVPAIQEGYVLHHKGDGRSDCNSFINGISTGMACGPYQQDETALRWTCEDKENRALLTSVNGKRHSCHRIEP